MSKKAIALVLSLASVFSMSACQFDRGDSVERDPTKTYLKVGVYNGDLGYEWLREIANAYQTENPDVVIEFDADKDRFNAGTLLVKMDDYRNDVYFVNGIDYQTFISQGKLADITDIVATNNIEGENETIASKLNPALRDYYNKGTETESKYYALPYFDAVFGTVYDVDLFEDFGFYYNTNGKLIMLDETNTELSVGPNGIGGDFDDGLPATYTEWKNLLYWLDQSGFLPYMWNKDDFYRQRWMTSIWADYEGKANLVVQSYAQLAKVYDDKSADIIKSNCNTQIFIGTTDYKTIEEFSKRCGNYSIVQRSVGFNTVKADDVNSNTSVKERPLIYPSELQQLNSKGNMGNAIVTVFGYQPLRARFTPSYASHFYRMKMTKQELPVGRYFDEAAAFYDMKKRNAILLEMKRKAQSGGKGGTTRENIAERRRTMNMLDKLQKYTMQCVKGIASEQETADIFLMIQTSEYDDAIMKLEEIKERVGETSDRAAAIQDVIERLEEMRDGEIRMETR